LDSGTAFFRPNVIRLRIEKPLSLVARRVNQCATGPAAGHRSCNRRVSWPPSLSLGRGRFCALLDSGSPENYLRDMNYRERITIDPRIRSGKPCIRGTRITVADVFDYLGGGMTIPEVLDDFPDLTADDIQACFAFAADRDRRLNVVPHEVAL